MSESAVSAKRGWVQFGAKSAQSETPARAAAKRRPPGGGRSGRKMRSPLQLSRAKGKLYASIIQDFRMETR